jgi:hypothetical protein
LVKEIEEFIYLGSETNSERKLMEFSEKIQSNFKFFQIMKGIIWNGDIPK